MRKKISDISDFTILVDLSNQVWRNHHGTMKKMIPNSNGILTGSIVGLCKTLQQAINLSKSSYGSLPKLVICEDRSPTRKRKLYYNNQSAFIDYAPDRTYEDQGLTDPKEKIRYKGNRVKEEMDYDPVQICREFLSCIPHTTIYCEGEEADDTMASYVFDHPDEEITLYSTDKDMWQLLDMFPKLKILLDGSGNYPDHNRMLKAFDTLDKGKILLHKMIRGDAGDNVKGVKRFPFKKSIKAFVDCDGTFESFFEQMYITFGEEDRGFQLLVKYMKLIILNYKLVNLKTDIDYEVVEVKEPHISKWKFLCGEYETPSITNLKLMEIF